MYERIRTELEAGGRAYIICPLVEASKSATLEDVKAAEDEHARLVAGATHSHTFTAGLLSASHHPTARLHTTTWSKAPATFTVDIMGMTM